MTEAVSSSETSVFTRAIRSNIQKDVILHSHRRENLKSYLNCTCFLPLLIYRMYILLLDWISRLEKIAYLNGSDDGV
jgi:hypothetical protein